VNQPSLFPDDEPLEDFDGKTYEREHDCVRLNAQLQRVYDVLVPGDWLTLREISDRTLDPEASISARIRDLRKPRFGAYEVWRRRRGPHERGLWEYKLGER